MAKKAGKLATRYARALTAAVEREQGKEGTGSQTAAQRAAAELTAFAKLWQVDAALWAFLGNPMFEKNERANALLEVAKRSGLQDILVRFLQVAFERDRIRYLPEIAESFSQIADAAGGVIQVEVVTARTIKADEQQVIEQGLARQLKGSLKFSWKTDATILGGMVVRYGGKVLDGSLAGRLARIESRLQSDV